MTFLWFQMIYAYETPEPAETKTPHEQNRHSPERILLLTTLQTTTTTKTSLKLNKIDWGWVGNGYQFLSVQLCFFPSGCHYLSLIVRGGNIVSSKHNMLQQRCPPFLYENIQRESTYSNSSWFFGIPRLDHLIHSHITWVSMLGKPVFSEMDEFSENFQTAFDPPPPLLFFRQILG